MHSENHSPTAPATLGESPIAPSDKGPFIVYYQAAVQCPVFFTRNVRGLVYSMCHLSLATDFPTREAAARMAFGAGIPADRTAIRPRP